MVHVPNGVGGAVDDHLACLIDTCNDPMHVTVVQLKAHVLADGSAHCAVVFQQLRICLLPLGKTLAHRGEDVDGEVIEIYLYSF